MAPHDASRCPDEETLAAYADLTLAVSERDAVDVHLAGCGVCREAAGALVEALLAGAPVPVLGLDDRILARLPDGASDPTSRAREGSMARLMRWIPMVAATAAAVVAAAILLADDGPRDASRGQGDAGAGPMPAAQVAGEGETRPPARSIDLGGTDRYLAHLSTDKPVYRPGERVFVRAALLNVFDHTPLGTPTYAVYEVRSGRGEVVHQVGAAVADGVAALGWEIPATAAGGRYAVKAMFPAEGFPEASIEFDVRDFRAPRLSTDLQFARKAYGPGDEVTATLRATRAEGGIPAGAAVAAVATVDGAEVARQAVTLDALGTCAVTFRLPAAIATGDGTLALTVTDGGVLETAAKTIPIVVRRVLLSMYPEGGDLVAGVACRVYVEARTPKLQPADVAGRVLDERGAVVATLATAHEGRGRFEFVPAEGRTYRLVLDRPAGVPDGFALPATLGTGIALAARADAFGPDEAVRVAVASRTGGAVTVGLYARERELALQAVRVPAGAPVEVVLAPREAASGVLRVTVYDAMGTPRAERLVLRRAPEALRVVMTPQAPDTVPAGRVKVDVLATDAHGRPVRTVLGVAATDDSVLAIVEPRERAARLPVAALLAAEVGELFDPTAYLGTDVASARNVDLLLGTQGWRRFAFSGLEAFVKAHEERALAVIGFRERPTRVSLPQSGPAGGAASGSGQSGPGDVSWAPPFARSIAHLAGGRPAKEGWEGEGLADAPPEGAYFVDGHADRIRVGRELLKFAEAGVVVDDKRRRADDGRDADLPAEESKPQGPRFKRPWGAGAVGGYAAGGSPLREPNDPPPPPPPWTRVYAHRAPTDRPAGARTDFAETVYWNAALATDAEGRATFEFDASDAITTIRVRADGVSADGGLAAADATVEVRRPFYVEAKLPFEVTAGDRIDVPVALVNGRRGAATAHVTLATGAGLAIVGDARREASLAALGSSRVVVPLEVGRLAAIVPVHLAASADVATDDVSRTVRVVPAGFPIERTFGGVLERRVEHGVDVPADVVEGSVTAKAIVYPTPLSSLTQALEALLAEPSGCFEQTSSSNYPNVMALQYLRSHAGVAPALVARAQALLARGYQRLTSFECKAQGYEWFGGDPGHEALTAYGVLEFADMATVMPVDAEMIARTRAWLRSRRDGRGGFLRNARALDAFGAAPADVTNAYILWAMVEAGERDLATEIAAAKATAAKTEDPYVLALIANALRRLEDADALPLLVRLAQKQGADGRMPGAATSITRSGGESLDVETTALAVLAWLRVPPHTREVERAMGWLAARCKTGRFGSTQATVLALKAIVAYDAAHAKTRAGGVAVLRVDDAEVARVPFAADREEPIVLPDVGAKLLPGRHVVQLAMEDGADLPYSLTVACSSRTPDSSSASRVALTVALAKAEATEGDPVDVAVTVRNATAEGLPMVTAIVGLPGGLEARADALRELVKAGTVDAFETRGREVILYWRAMAPSAAATFSIPCVAAIPGRYTGPASRAYLYYTDEHKVWVPGVALSITAR